MRIDAGSSDGVAAFQLAVGRSDPARFAGACFQLGSQRKVFAGEAEVIEDRLDVEAGPADEQRSVPSGFDVLDRGAGQGLRSGRGPVVGRVGNVDEVMGLGFAVPTSSPR